MTDYSVVNVPYTLKRKVRTFARDERGNVVEVQDDGAFHDHGVKLQYVLAKFLADNNLLLPGVRWEPHPELIIRRSQLTQLGLEFIKTNVIHKWFRHLDATVSVYDPVDTVWLEKRWIKFCKERGIK